MGTDRLKDLEHHKASVVAPIQNWRTDSPPLDTPVCSAYFDIRREFPVKPYPGCPERGEHV